MGGLNSASHLQACMERLLGDLSGIGCYQDDILGCAKTGGSHVEKLRSVFSRLERKGLKLQLEKVILWAREVVFVGHKFTAAGCTADPSKVAALVGLERPETIKELSLFAHSSGFLRPYVLRFAELTAPLTNVINDALKKCPKKGIKRTRAKAKKVNWDIPGLDEAWNKFKYALGHCILNSHRKPGWPLMTASDASKYAWGSLIFQVHPEERNLPLDEMRTVEILAVDSGTFKGAQKRWAIVDKEAFGVIQPFILHPCLLSTGSDESPVRILTDHRNLLFLLTGSPGRGDAASKQCRARLLRFASELSTFRTEISHCEGETNVLADFISRTGQKSAKIASGGSVEGRICLLRAVEKELSVDQNAEFHRLLIGSWDNATVPSGKQIREAQFRARKEIIEKKVKNIGRKIMSTAGMKGSLFVTWRKLPCWKIIRC